MIGQGSYAIHMNRPTESNKNSAFLHKNPGLPGSVQAQYVRCGKPNCRCVDGEKHGPYWRRYWREGGRTKSVYVQLEESDQVRTEVALWREKYPSARALVKEMNRLLKVLDQTL